MISKIRLLAGLNELVYVEEGMVAVFTNFSKALVRDDNTLTDKEKDEITKLLTRLQNDSAKHKKKVEEIISRVEEEGVNEY